jgi:hypothetical protein
VQPNQPAAPVPAPAPVPVSTYTIQQGDTFELIASKLGTTAAALEAANPGVNPSTLQVGQSIILGSSTSSSGPQTPQANVSTSGVGGAYIFYSGPSSNYPSPSQWAPYEILWEQNSKLMAYNDSPAQVALIGTAILAVSAETGVDPRAILCTIMQESGGNVHVGNTFNGIVNTGIMQAFNGSNFDPGNEAGSILSMVRDGAGGTALGPGLKQDLAQTGGDYYQAFRVYNSGSVDVNDLNNPLGATAKYVTDMANRLVGHVWAGM